MAKKFAVLFCLIILGFGVFCPSICMARELSDSRVGSCCAAGATQSKHETCNNSCDLHVQTIVSDQSHALHSDVASLDFAIFVPLFNICPSVSVCCSSFDSQLFRPPDHLVLLKMIRLQC